MTKGILIPADNDKPLEIQEFSDLKVTLSGQVERFGVNRPDASLFQSESAVYLELPTNRRATLMLWCHATSLRGKQALQGDVALVGPLSDQGEPQDVPLWYVAILLEAKRFKVHKQRIDDGLWREHSYIFSDWLKAYTTILLEAEKDALTQHVRVVPA